jgi:hypothetical protein
MRYTRRFVVFLAAALVATHVFAGLAAAYLVQRIDARYAALLEPQLAAEADLDRVVSAIDELHRLVLNRLLDVDAAEVAEIRLAVLLALADNEHALAGLHRVPSADAVANAAGLDAAWLAYRGTALQVLELAEESHHAEALALRRDRLRPEREHYLNILDRVAERLRQQMLHDRDHFSREARGGQIWLLSLSAWPFVALLALILVAVALALAARGLIQKQDF